MAFKSLPDLELLNQILEYDPVTGVMRHRYRDRSLFRAEHYQKAWNTKYAGKDIVATNWFGHLLVNINYVEFKAHRVAFKMYYGRDPVLEIDHINRIPSDNRICNLREVTRSQNQRNSRIRSDSKLGIKGVRMDRRKFIARINVDGTNLYLGTFNTAAEARIARVKAEAELWTG